MAYIKHFSGGIYFEINSTGIRKFAGLYDYKIDGNYLKDFYGKILYKIEGDNVKDFYGRILMCPPPASVWQPAWAPSFWQAGKRENGLRFRMLRS